VLRVGIREVSRGHSSWQYEPIERSEDSRTNEGLNVKLFPMRLGGLNNVEGSIRVVY
jgi:hypothetical protein